MGMLTTFFAAPAADLKPLNLSEGIPAAYPSESCASIDEMKLAALENILTGRDPSECMKSLMSRCVYSHDESGISVLQLGEELVKALAPLTPDTAMEPAKKWLAGDGWKGFGRRAGDLKDLADLVVSIAKLASAALAPGHGLFFWSCP